METKILHLNNCILFLDWVIWTTYFERAIDIRFYICLQVLRAGSDTKDCYERLPSCAPSSNHQDCKSFFNNRNSSAENEGSFTVAIFEIAVAQLWGVS